MPGGLTEFDWSHEIMLDRLTPPLRHHRDRQRELALQEPVLSKFAATAGLKLTLRVKVAPTEGVSPQKVDETKVAPRELGLKDSLEGE